MKEHIADRLHILDAIVLHKLRAQGRKTRLQLQGMGLSIIMIQQLEEMQILLKEHDVATNLHYYKVNDGLFEGTKR